MVQFKYFFGISILIIVLISGCVNSNESAQKIKESKVINFDPQEIILNDSEIKDVLGNEWNIVRTINIEGSIGIGIVYDNSPAELGDVNAIIGGGEWISLPIFIQLRVYPDVFSAEKWYRYDRDSISKKEYKGNEINITDIGYIYSQKQEQGAIIKTIFRKNNVISVIYLETKKSKALNADSAFNLAKKQEAKISKILDMIK